MALAEPVDAKRFDELYTAFGRAALGNQPALLLLGSEPETPQWFSKLAAGLKEVKADDVDAEAATKAALTEASKATSLGSVREGVAELLATIGAAQTLAKGKGKPLFAATYSGDAATLAAFNVTLVKGQYALFVAALDRKDLAASVVTPYEANPIAVTKKGKPDSVKPLEAFARAVATAAKDGPSALRAVAELAVAQLPSFPKPASVLAAEERALKKKASQQTVVSLLAPADLTRHCYELAASKTCALLVSSDAAAAAQLAPLAAKYAREGFAFSVLDASTAPAELVAALAADTPLPALVVVKGGRRPRAARATEGGFEALIDGVVGGQGKFDKFAAGLPVWQVAVDAEAQDAASDEYDL